MSHYENGLETKKRILAACRKLFYQKGYQNTTFKDICAEAQINQSSIHYHFKSKEVLLRLIYDETIVKNNREVERYASEDTLLFTKFLLSTNLYIYKLLHDARYFQLNFDANILLDVSYFENQIRILAGGIYGDSTNVVVLSEQDYFKVIAIAGFDHSFLIHLNTGSKPKDYEQLTKYSAETYRRILEIDNETFHKATQQLANLEAQVRWDQLDTTLDI